MLHFQPISETSRTLLDESKSLSRRDYCAMGLFVWPFPSVRCVSRSKATRNLYCNWIFSSQYLHIMNEEFTQIPRSKLAVWYPLRRKAEADLSLGLIKAKETVKLPLSFHPRGSNNVSSLLKSLHSLLPFPFISIFSAAAAAVRNWCQKRMELAADPINFRWWLPVPPAARPAVTQRGARWGVWWEREKSIRHMSILKNCSKTTVLTSWAEREWMNVIGNSITIQCDEDIWSGVTW